MRARSAAEALIAELNNNGIQTRSHAADLQFPEGVIVIRVGMKPNPASQRFLRERMEEMGFPENMIERVVPPKKKQ